MTLNFFVYEEDGVKNAINLLQVVSATVSRVDGKQVLVISMTDGERLHLHADFIVSLFAALGPLDAKRFG